MIFGNIPPETDHIRPEIRDLIRRGNVTPAEVAELLCNSWEWEALVPVMNNEAFVARMEHTIKNCLTPSERPFLTYNKALEGLYAPELLRRFKKASEGAVYHQQRWLEYEREYILPCFEWAKEIGFDLQQAVHDNPGKNCVRLLVDRLRAEAREASDLARELVVTLGRINDALGKAPGGDIQEFAEAVRRDIRELVEAIESRCDAMLVLKRIRGENGGHPVCLACRIEAEIGTEETPHPVPERFHVCVSLKTDPAPELDPSVDEERTDRGTINNCALANFAEEKDCQVCLGRCPDRERFEESMP